MSYDPLRPADHDPICECPVCKWKDSLSLTLTHKDIPHCPRCLRPVEVLIPAQRIIHVAGGEYDPNADTK